MAGGYDKEAARARRGEKRRLKRRSNVFGKKSEWIPFFNKKTNKNVRALSVANNKDNYIEVNRLWLYRATRVLRCAFGNFAFQLHWCWFRDLVNSTVKSVNFFRIIKMNESSTLLQTRVSLLPSLCLCI